MEKLSSIEEYYKLIKEAKKKCRISFSNMYAMPNELQRYIELGRIFYESCDAGILFFFDEEKYYKLCLYVDANIPFCVSAMDKKILVRNIFRNGNDLSLINKALETNRFEKRGTSIQIRGDVNYIVEEKKAIEKGRIILDRGGYQFLVADVSLLNQIEELLEEVSFIEDYHIAFKTRDEKLKNIENGGYLCIVDHNNKVCAATITWENGDVAEGTAIAVRDAYKMLGMAPLISYERLKRLKEKKIDYLQGWVVLDNEPSIRYHKNMGFQFMDRYADEWILEAGE
ncbi:MAG: GNAT family N-acetyltransferase [Lachnospiraceae bacterium]|nr:GNAT family N-acetyltransferase [Lachnospiraceae bacterium]